MADPRGVTVKDTMDARTRRWTADAALAALATGADLAVVLVSRNHHGGDPSRVDPFGIILVVTGGLALLARRPYPATTLAVVLGATLGAGALGAGGGWLALIIAFFSAVLRGRRWSAVGSLVIGYAVSVWGASLVFALGLLAGLVTLLSVAELSVILWKYPWWMTARAAGRARVVPGTGWPGCPNGSTRLAVPSRPAPGRTGGSA